MSGPRFVSERERPALRALAALANGNPFLQERVASEKQALGSHFTATSAFWHVEADLDGLNPNVAPLNDLADELVPRLRARIEQGARPEEADLVLYEGAVRYWLYNHYEVDFRGLIGLAESGKPTTKRLGFFERFRDDVVRWLHVPEVEFPFSVAADHLFAWGFQIRRAFHQTFRQIHGGSPPAAGLRANVWHSIFTNDAQRYRRALFDRMGDAPTLITGESGTGKELVARAIALSRYIPFDETAGSFVEDYASSFHAVNLSALSPTLIESELFGHRKGSFTGAVSDRVGWFESCGAAGTVFLDEIGELDPGIQVKLLRVLQSRGFQRIGDTEERRFQGKIVAATHRDLAAGMEDESFRSDFYWRLCADRIETPTLREQLAEDPGELANLVFVVARRIAGANEGRALADEAHAWIVANLGPDYAWPGNVRELEQCVRSVLIRGEYRPPQRRTGGSGDGLGVALRDTGLSADDLLRRYCTEVYAQTGSYEEAARRLAIDRRTVKAKVDPELLARLRGEH